MSQSLELPEVSPSPPLTVQHSPAPPALLVPGGWRIEGLPRTVRAGGPSAERRLLEFFTAEISNPNTRLAYATAAGRFFRWCETRNLALREITPFAVATYIEEMQDAMPTHRQAAPLSPPGPARLPGRGPGPALEPCRTGPRTQIRGQARQDPGALPPARPAPCSTRSTSPSPRGSGIWRCWPPWSTPSPGSAPSSA